MESGRYIERERIKNKNKNKNKNKKQTNQSLYSRNSKRNRSLGQEFETNESFLGTRKWKT